MFATSSSRLRASIRRRRLAAAFAGALAPIAGAIVLGATLLSTPAGPAAAQSDLSREMEILKRDLRDLQRYIYRGEGQPPAPTGEGAGAPTPPQGEAMPTDVAGRLQVKMQRLEREMRDLTGRVEQAEFRARQVDQRLEKLSSDIDFRLQRLERQAGLGVQTSQAAGTASAGASGVQPSASGGRTAAGDQQGTTVISSAGTTQESGADAPQTLGTLRTNAEGEVVGAEIAPRREDAALSDGSSPQQAAAPSAPQPPPQPGSVSGAEATAAAPSGVLPDGTVQEQYDYAFSLLRKRDFAAAEQAMRSFVDKHGDSGLAGNAMYWLGETYYARENYRDAAATFLDAYTGYPQNDKASHSLLKLAMSLGALGKQDAACQAFSTLAQDGNASERILSTGRSEAEKLGCS
ncbi:MAG: tol-pal system protein YbgF [Marivibrio sp.]|uniref:tol-pal system protein YbgF n=1 Tax=Marivibrio sp. TaxID=2039719 RepID=UPI0032ED2650